MAIRLARFNTGLNDEKDDIISKDFFTGIPAPAGALLLLLPMVFDFGAGELLGSKIRQHTLVIDFYYYEGY